MSTINTELGRRKLLAAGGTGVLGAFGGFFANDVLEPEPSKEPRLGTIRLWNRDDTAHDVEIVRTGGQVVHWDTHHLPAEGSTDDPVSLRTPADRRGFSVLAHLTDGTTAWTNGDGSEYEQAAPNTDPGCFIVTVEPRNAGPELVRSKSGNARCDGPEFGAD